MATNRNTTIARHVDGEADNRTFDVGGTTLEFVTPPDGDGDFCVMRGVIPPGGIVPLHSHDDSEMFFVLSGTQRVLIEGPAGLEWHDVQAGDCVQVGRGAPHAWRNDSAEPVIDLIVATRRLGRFFQELGKPVIGDPEPPTAADLARLVALSAEYGYWLGSPEQNAAVGIEVPPL